MTGITAIAVPAHLDHPRRGWHRDRGPRPRLHRARHGRHLDRHGQDLVWLSFLGWAEQVSPFGENRCGCSCPPWSPLAALLVVADALLHRRDLGSGLWAARPGPAHASAAAGSPLGLAWRLQRGSLLGWTIGYAVVGLVVGNIAKSVDQIASSPDVEEMLRKMSGGQGSLLDVFFGTEIRFLAIGVAAYGIATALRLRSEESAGRAEVVLADTREPMALARPATPLIAALGLALAARRGRGRPPAVAPVRSAAPGSATCSRPPSRPHPPCWCAWR